MKNILITGANRGLGLGFTEHYLQQGCRVFAAARNPGDCTDLADLAATFGDSLSIVPLDLASEASIGAAAAAIGDAGLDLVLNNAGTLPDEKFGSWSADAFANAFAVNATGPALVAQAVTPRMKRGSKLVNISSGLGSCGLAIEPETGLDAYAASKAALNMITVRLAAKLAPNEITVVAFDPGWVRTRMGGPDAELTVDESIGALVATIDRLTITDSGRFLSRHGSEVPW
jgi:NAD(P)-dependent dehydrogenase (short-subunit alcohol dehydrogenase family)